MACQFGAFGQHNPAMHGEGCDGCDAEHARVWDKHIGTARPPLACGHAEDNRLPGAADNCATCALHEAIEWRDEELRRLESIVDEARQLIEIKCGCHHCWTNRRQHDPSGCTFEETRALAAALARYDEESADDRSADR